MKAKTLISLLLLSLTVSAQHYLGEKFGGGFIFYIDQSGEHGLIAAPIDHAEVYKWGCVRNIIYADKLSDGIYNTNKISDNCSKPNAAIACIEYNEGGFNDWYLPAIDELNLLYKNRIYIPSLTTADYCSSTEATDGNDCWAIHFQNDGQNFHYNKGSYFHIRAIRKF